MLAGNLGRISMSIQEMVRLFHSPHSHTAGQESTAFDARALARRLKSVNSAHVITCIAGLVGLRDKDQKATGAKFVTAELHSVSKKKLKMFGFSVI